MKKTHYVSGLIAASTFLLLASCGSKEHGLNGTLSDAENGSYIVLETTDIYGRWYPLDSAAIDSEGKFFLPYAAPSAPELYRLRFGESYIYMPVDSTEELTLTASAKDFSRSFTLAGSAQAEGLTRFEKEASRIEALRNTDSTDVFRRRVYTEYLQNSKGDLLSYYILTRRFDEGHLIEYTDPIYWAVANLYSTYRPDDKRTKALVERARQGQAEVRRSKNQGVVMEAAEIALIDIELPDSQGTMRRLSEVASKGKPTILVFTTMSSQQTPAINMALRSIYDAGEANIYEVCIDNDVLTFSNGAKGLPWPVVRDDKGADSENLIRYNVGSLPAFFIYDSRGELQQSAGTVEDARNHLRTLR